MKRLYFTIIFAFFGYMASGTCPDTLSHLAIDIRGGAAYGLYRDFGAAPLTFRGYELTPGLGLSSRTSLWICDVSLDAAGGVYGLQPKLPYLQYYGGQGQFSISALRCVSDMAPFSIWLGGAVDDIFDLRYNPSLANANTGYTNFLRLNIVGRIEYRLSRWLLYGQLGLNPMALLLRPGFAYIDNFDRNIGNANANNFDQYHWYLTGAVGAATLLGADYLLANGNRVGFFYQWHHVTSRTTSDHVTAPYCFDQAAHALVFHLSFALKQ